MKPIKLYTLFLAAILVAACTADTAVEPQPTTGQSNPIILTATQGGNIGTRLAYEYKDETGHLLVTWTKGDAFTLFADDTESSVFTTQDNGTQSATFTGNDVTGEVRNAFFPALRAEKRWQDCYYTVLGQVIDATAPTAHLSDYNYMTAIGIAADATSITFTHRIAVLKFAITLPDGKTPTTVSLSTQDDADIDQTTGIAVTAKAQDNSILNTAKHLSAAIKNANTNSLDVYMAVLPSTLNDHLALAVTDSEGSVYNYTVTGFSDHEYAAEHIYTATLDYTGMTAEYNKVSVFTNEIAGGEGTAWTNGLGNENDPYLIESADHLKYLVKQVSDGNNYADTHFKLTTDIHVTADEWTPIGTSNSAYFNGTFDGGGHTIGGKLETTSNPNYFGFFGYTINATINNIHMAADFPIEINNPENYKNYSYGGVIGQAEETQVINCSYTGSMNFTLKSPNDAYIYIGKICGISMNSSFLHCYANGDLTANTSSASVDTNCSFAGIVGFLSSSTVSKCTNNGIVEFKLGSGNVGGIGGKCYRSTINYCYNRGTIAGGEYIGGLVGVGYDDNYNYISSIHTSHNLSNNINPEYSKYKGRLVGGSIHNSYKPITPNCSTSVEVDGIASDFGYNNPNINENINMH